MSSERIIGEFYAALPLGSGGKPHNARCDSIDEAWQLRRPPGAERRQLKPRGGTPPARPRRLAARRRDEARRQDVAAEIKSKNPVAGAD
jgi:hypothetical protein